MCGFRSDGLPLPEANVGELCLSFRVDAGYPSKRSSTASSVLRIGRRMSGTALEFVKESVDSP